MLNSLVISATLYIYLAIITRAIGVVLDWKGNRD